MTTEQGDLLDLIANDPRKEDDYSMFVAACRSEAYHANGIVSINDVRMAFETFWGLSIEPRRYSSFWRRARLDGHLERTGEWETNTDVRGRNSGKPQPVYRWTGARA
jgi:hypothetical protein